MTLLIPNDVLALIFEAYSFVGGILLVLFPVILLLMLTSGMKDDKVKPIRGLIFILAGVLAMGLAAELAYAYTYGWEREMADWIEFSGAVLFITGLIMLIGSISVGGGETLGEKLFGGSKKKDEKDAKKEAEKVGEGPDATEDGNGPAELDEAMDNLTKNIDVLHKQSELLKDEAIRILSNRYVHGETYKKLQEELKSKPKDYVKKYGMTDPINTDEVAGPGIQSERDLKNFNDLAIPIFFSTSEEDKSGGTIAVIINQIEEFMQMPQHSKRSMGQAVKFQGILMRFNTLVEMATMMLVRMAKVFPVGIKNPDGFWKQGPAEWINWINNKRKNWKHFKKKIKVSRR